MTEISSPKNLVEVFRAVVLAEAREIGCVFTVHKTEWEELAQGISGVADILYLGDEIGRRAFLSGVLGSVLGVEVIQVAEPALQPSVHEAEVISDQSLS